MRPTQHFLFPAALFGSFLVGILGFTVTSGFSSPPGRFLMVSGKQTISQVNVFFPTVASMSIDHEDSSPGQESDQHTSFNGEVDTDTACLVSVKYPDKIRRWCNLISQYSQINNLDADLVAALIWQESGGNSAAYSRSGAVGLMQVMPRDGIASSFMCKNGPCFTNRPTISELEDPEFNIKYGTRMLANLHSHYGNLRDALKHYGPMDVGYSYADKVWNIYNNYKQ
ncbi:MAG: transglycosylase SLT domain-containing protein [Anaerolineales bacterium]|nr:transglycosylase SLT domain-containing protein [Anaerolineales bacterium]